MAMDIAWVVDIIVVIIQFFVDLGNGDVLAGDPRAEFAHRRASESCFQTCAAASGAPFLTLAGKNSISINPQPFLNLMCFIQNGYNSEAASEAYFNRYPERRQPNMSIFGRLKENLVEYGGFNKPRPKNYRIQDAEDVAINVVGMVVVNPSISSRQIEAESGISRRRALSVLKKHKFRPYTIRKQQQLLPTDPERRLDFCNWYLQQIEQDQLFFKNIIWTDESYVSSAGIFNRHNKHYWSEDNPHQTVDVQNQGRFGFSVWCALYNNRILAYQLYDDNLNGQRSSSV
ncbi:hypothetical protein NQ318_021534 [Aromia moschata]|uniref:Transposase n=1 Tax=Aromia moschata TaxID=1265417 RepID=A0AAV8ZEX2_9CUCU|nr:hypothetical protein NQ318_021534 [Aromia moschata]